MHPAFTLEQHAVMSQWSAGRPLGLRIEIDLEHEDYLEMAHIIPHRALDPVYHISATDDGGVVVGEAVGLGQETFLEMAVALARVLELEQALVHYQPRGRQEVERCA